ncbi:hypothetical protein AVEN_152407-1 [Araneus ventricosus]|uniref:Uncharacterized protein n=1 Tax=Araneus ventricosus TaxID=182803 RepID=A0A4Y2V3A5_ARAVE|nr:hypothetical protein AVEN_140177-1 [Araneus ventricosus]GBO30063.1 hypothetical protein AVEN_152407-1 [Araneus ventricosus]
MTWAGEAGQEQGQEEYFFSLSMNFKLLIWPLRSLANAVCAVLVPSDRRDIPGRFPAYHSCAGGTFQVEFALALWIKDISDAKSSPEAAEGRALPSFANKSPTSLPKTPTWEGIH